MDIIEQYVNALFAKLPASLEILHLRDDVLEEARASYARLCEDGLDRDAAVGRVLSRLGSLNEILARHGMDASVANAPSAPSDPSDPPVIENEALSDETEDYLDAQYNITRMIAMGVGLCICSPIFPLFFDNSFPILGHWIGDWLGAVGFFGAIALAVMLFIYAGSMQKSWHGYAHCVTLTAGMRQELRRRAADYAAQRTVNIAVGVGLCIFSPAMPIFFNSSFGAALMFAFVAVGVYMIILSGVRGKACRTLLKNS